MKLNTKEIMDGKQRNFISNEEALKDVEPFIDVDAIKNYKSLTVRALEGKKMLETPKHGWSSLSLTDEAGVDHSFRLSYIDDVPTTLMNHFILSLENRMDVAIEFDAEGWAWRLIVGDFTTYVITEKEDVQLFSFEITKEEFIQKLYYDLKTDLEAWVNWDSDCEFMTENTLQEHKSKFISLFNKFESTIETHIQN